jgi:hypothetical protein
LTLVSTSDIIRPVVRPTRRWIYNEPQFRTIMLDIADTAVAVSAKQFEAIQALVKEASIKLDSAIVKDVLNSDDRLDLVEIEAEDRTYYTVSVEFFYQEERKIDDLLLDELLDDLRQIIFGTHYPEKTFCWDTDLFRNMLSYSSTEFYIA